MAVDPALLQRVRDLLVDDPAPLSLDRVGDAVRRTGSVLGDRGLLDLLDAVRADLVGAGPLEAVLAEPDVTDVVVNGAAGVWVDRGAGLERRDVDVGGEPELRRLATRLAAGAGRRLDDASPWVDARLPDGARLHAVLPPVVQGGTHLSLRLPRRTALGFADLEAAGTVPPGWSPVLRALVSERAAYLVTGGTGTGKTTLLAALLGLVPAVERIVVVEDSAELQVDHPHVVRLEGRPANVEGVGEVSMTDLVRQALRMRPDRLVVGEVRGAEIRDLLGALNTGHEGGCGTVHANTPSDLPARLDALGALAGLDPTGVESQVAAAIQVVVHMRRHGAARRVAEIGVVRRDSPRLAVVPALTDRRRLVRTSAASETSGPGATDVGAGWAALADRLGLDAGALRGEA